MDTDQSDISLYKVNPKDGSELVLVPGGWFWMGMENGDQVARAHEKPRHMHYVAPFYMGIACVTVAQFWSFVSQSRYDAGSGWKKNYSEHPVHSVSWNDAIAYCNWAGLRLPTEAEWELVAREYGELKYPWGNDWEDGRRVCWDRQKGPKGNTAPVYAHPPGVSRFGSFQQSGNLLEWCADAFYETAYGRYARGDFTVPSHGFVRVVRGGSWFSIYLNNFLGGYRAPENPEKRIASIGFRVAAGTM